MIATARQPYLNCSISVIVTGSTLMDRVHPLQLDPDKSFYLASDFAEAIQQAETLAPSVLVTENRMLAGVDLNDLRIRLALGRSVRILVYMDEPSELRRRELLLAGIAGFLDPRQSRASTRRAIREAAKGMIWASREALSDAIRAMVSVVSDPRFTKRELEILRRIAAGQDNRTIANNLFITRETVRWHLRSAYAKLGVHDRRSAVEMIRRSA
jgi:DNA-binding NarL/FixJ family response regulator